MAGYDFLANVGNIFARVKFGGFNQCKTANSRILQVGGFRRSKIVNSELAKITMQAFPKNDGQLTFKNYRYFYSLNIKKIMYFYRGN
jgi:hypothetical protein